MSNYKQADIVGIVYNRIQSYTVDYDQTQQKRSILAVQKNVATRFTGIRIRK